MKALEKDRTRRYETASAFAEDVVRHLEDRPVEAGRPGAGYRITKFARRNKRAVVAVLVFAAALGLGFAGTTAGFVSARAEADRSRRISESLEDVLAMTDPSRGADRSDVERVLATVREVFGEDHATYAAVLDTLSQRLHDAGDFDAAEELCRESLAVWKKVYGEEHPNVAITLARLGSLLRAQGEDMQGESVLRSALAIFEATDETSGAPGLAGYDARVDLADLLANRGEYQEADELYGASLALLRSSSDPSRFRMLTTLEKRLVVQLNQPSVDASETLREIYEETHEFYPDDSPFLANAAFGLGNYLSHRDEPEAAEPYLREAVQRFRASSDPPVAYHMGASEALFTILRNRTDSEGMAEADELLNEVIEVGNGVLGADSKASLKKLYASRMMDRGRLGDALGAIIEGHQALVDAGRSVEERENLRDNMTALAFEVAVEPGREPEIYARAREAVERARAEEPDHPAMAVALGAILYRQGEFALASEMLDLDKPLTRHPGNLARKMAPADHVFRALAHARLGHDAIAREELASVLAIFDGKDPGAEGNALLGEIEALLEPTPAPTGDGGI